MPGEDDGDGPRGQLPLFTLPRFNWNQDNLYEQFKNFKRVVEFAFKGQCEKCSNSIKCGSILNWSKMFFNLGMPLDLYIVVHSRLSQNSITNSTVWPMIAISLIKMK